jgi:hypothetical protein
VSARSMSSAGWRNYVGVPNKARTARSCIF